MTDKDDKNNKPDLDSPQRMQLLLPPKIFWRIFLLLAGLTLFFLFIWNISWFWKNLLALLGMLTPFIVGAALAFVIKIPMNSIERQLDRISWLQKRRGLSRVFSIILSLLFVTVFIAGVFTLVLPQLVQSINMLVARMPDFVKQVADWMEDVEFLEPYAEGVREELGSFSWKLIVEKLGSFLRSGAGVFDNLFTAVSSIMSGLTNSIISFLFMLYMLAAKERVGEHSRRLIYSFSRERIADKIIYVFHIMHENFTAFVSSTVVGAAVAGALTFIAMVILRLPYAGMISVVVGVSNLIPIIGSIVGVGIGTLIILIVSPIQALIFLIAAILANQIEGNILFPKLMGKVMGLPAMWSLLAISLGGSLLGIIGIWFFVPLFASAYALLAEASAVRLKKKQIDITEKVGADVAYKVRLDMGMSEEEAQAWVRKRVSPKAARDNFKKSLKRICARIFRKK